MDQLLFAIQSHDQPTIVASVSDGNIDLNAIDTNIGMSPLGAAIVNENVEAMTTLLKHGANINAPCVAEVGYVPLHLAALLSLNKCWKSKHYTMPKTIENLSVRTIPTDESLATNPTNALMHIPQSTNINDIPTFQASTTHTQYINNEPDNTSQSNDSVSFDDTELQGYYQTSPSTKQLQNTTHPNNTTNTNSYMAVQQSIPSANSYMAVQQNNTTNANSSSTVHASNIIDTNHVPVQAVSPISIFKNSKNISNEKIDTNHVYMTDSSLQTRTDTCTFCVQSTTNVILQLLLGAGADIHKVDQFGQTVLYKAVTLPFIQLVRRSSTYIATLSADFDAIMIAFNMKEDRDLVHSSNPNRSTVTQTSSKYTSNTTKNPTKSSKGLKSTNAKNEKSSPIHSNSPRRSMSRTRQRVRRGHGTPSLTIGTQQSSTERASNKLTQTLSLYTMAHNIFQQTNSMKTNMLHTWQNVSMLADWGYYPLDSPLSLVKNTTTVLQLLLQNGANVSVRDVLQNTVIEWLEIQRRMIKESMARFMQIPTKTHLQHDSIQQKKKTNLNTINILSNNNDFIQTVYTRLVAGLAVLDRFQHVILQYVRDHSEAIHGIQRRLQFENIVDDVDAGMLNTRSYAGVFSTTDRLSHSSLSSLRDGQMNTRTMNAMNAENNSDLENMKDVPGSYRLSSTKSEQLGLVSNTLSEPPIHIPLDEMNSPFYDTIQSALELVHTSDLILKTRTEHTMQRSTMDSTDQISSSATSILTEERYQNKDHMDQIHLEGVQSSTSTEKASIHSKKHRSTESLTQMPTVQVDTLSEQFSPGIQSDTSEFVGQLSLLQSPNISVDNNSQQLQLTNVSSDVTTSSMNTTSSTNTHRQLDDRSGQTTMTNSSYSCSIAQTPNQLTDDHLGTNQHGSSMTASSPIVSHTSNLPKKEDIQRLEYEEDDASRICCVIT